MDEGVRKACASVLLDFKAMQSRHGSGSRFKMLSQKREMLDAKFKVLS